MFSAAISILITLECFFFFPLHPLGPFFAFKSARETKQFSTVKSLLTHDAVQWHEKMLGRKQRIHPTKKGRPEYFKEKRPRRKVKMAALASERSQLPGRRDGTLIPQLAQQVQFTAKVRNFLNPHLSFKRVPRFSSSVVSSVFFQTYLWDTSESEIAPFIYGKWMRRFLLLRRGDSKEG